MDFGSGSDIFLFLIRIRHYDSIRRFLFIYQPAGVLHTNKTKIKAVLFPNTSYLCLCVCLCLCLCFPNSVIVSLTLLEPDPNLYFLVAPACKNHWSQNIFTFKLQAWSRILHAYMDQNNLFWIVSFLFI